MINKYTKISLPLLLFQFNNRQIGCNRFVNKIKNIEMLSIPKGRVPIDPQELFEKGRRAGETKWYWNSIEELSKVKNINKE